jgi:hypothetical protein
MTSYLPEIGEPDPAALEYINAVWEQVPVYYLVSRHGAPPTNLRDLIRFEKDAIRHLAPFRRWVVGHVEKATGTPYGVEAPDA